MSAPMDHLDRSPSETVRRHAATFRQVRLAREAAVAERGAGRDELSDEHRIEVVAREARSDEMPPPARKLAQTARERGWRVEARYARGRVDSVVVRALRAGSSDEFSDEHGSVALIAAWKAQAPRPPMKWRWAWWFGVTGCMRCGLRSIGAREGSRLVSSDDVECCVVTISGG